MPVERKRCASPSFSLPSAARIIMDVNDDNVHRVRLQAKVKLEEVTTAQAELYQALEELSAAEKKVEENRQRVAAAKSAFTDTERLLCKELELVEVRKLGKQFIHFLFIHISYLYSFLFLARKYDL